MAVESLDLATILETQRMITPHVRRTPLIHSAYLSERSGAEVWLKLENQQPTGSFKVRGALSKIGRLSPSEKGRGVVVASAGNHALGVAYAIQRLGNVTADIFVPTTAPRAKVEKLRHFDVTVRPVGQTYDEAQKAATTFAAESGRIQISAYDDVEVIMGQATIGLEIMADLAPVDVILVPVGGGGLIAGIATVASTMSPTCRVVAVQPEASPAALLSLRDGRPYESYDHEATIADGLAGGFGAVPFRLARNLIDTILLATEAELRRAVFTLLDQEQLVVEASGAIAIAPLLSGQLDVAGRTVACVLTGGNLDTALLRDILFEMTGDRRPMTGDNRLSPVAGRSSSRDHD